MVEFFDRGDGCWHRGFAGDTLNVAWALRALLPADHPVGYVTRVGADAVSDAMVAFLAGAGLDISAVGRAPDRTVGLYTIATDAEGERSFAYWRDTSAARLLAQDPVGLANGFMGARLIYFFRDHGGDNWRSGARGAFVGPGDSKGRRVADRL